MAEEDPEDKKSKRSQNTQNAPETRSVIEYVFWKAPYTKMPILINNLQELCALFVCSNLFGC